MNSDQHCANKLQGMLFYDCQYYYVKALRNTISICLMNVLQKRLLVETFHEDSLDDRGLVRGELLEEALLHEGG